MTASEWIILVFVFSAGCCMGSLLNRLIHLLPRGISLIATRSACPACGSPIRLLDAIPLLSWLVSGGRCRLCKAPVSPRPFVIEFLTGMVFLGVFLWYFRANQVRELPAFADLGWLIYLVHIILLCALIVASAIDLELQIIPLQICWFVTGVAIVGMTGAAAALGRQGAVPSLIPIAGPVTGALATGGMAGLAISLVLLSRGMIQRSYESKSDTESSEGDTPAAGPFEEDHHFNHRQEMGREVVFLGPIIVSALTAYWIYRSVPAVGALWGSVMARPWVAGALGSVWGYLVGSGMVWLGAPPGDLGPWKRGHGSG